MNRPSNRPTLPWLTLEGNSGPDEYMHYQQQELESVLESVRGKFDGWSIQFWESHWEEENQRWIIEIHPGPAIDIISYYRNK